MVPFSNTGCAKLSKQITPALDSADQGADQGGGGGGVRRSARALLGAHRTERRLLPFEKERYTAGF